MAAYEEQEFHQKLNLFAWKRMFQFVRPYRKNFMLVIGLILFSAPVSYTHLTNDFMASGGDGYTMLGNYPIENEFSALDEALILSLIHILEATWPLASSKRPTWIWSKTPKAPPCGRRCSPMA